MEETRFTESGENASETKDERSAENEQLEYIMKSGSVVSRRDGESVHCLTIIGQIEGHYTVTDGSKATKYEHIIPLLVSVEESDDIDGMLMVLNTMGGDVEAGLAIAEMVASMSKPTVSLVLGGGHSIGDEDDTHGKNERHRDRRAADLLLFRENAGQDHQIRHQAFGDHRGKIQGIPSCDRPDRNRYGIADRRDRGGLLRTDR